MSLGPDRQGQGIGSALIKVGLDEADRARVPAFLGTSNPRNLPLYMHHGFVVDEEYNVGPARVWAMLRRVA
ncbi:MAG: GNAT family N-acetyltransferase [Acidimicrobiia bacterium]